MKRPFDTSRAKCDRCGKPYKEGDAVYSIADKYDENEKDRDVLVSFRHWECHTPVETSLKNLRASINQLDKLANELRRRGL